MKTLTQLRSSAPIWFGSVLILAGIAINAIAHPHDNRLRPRKRAAWNQPDHRQPQFRPALVKPRGHVPQAMHQPDARVREFLFPPQRAVRPVMKHPVMQRPARSPEQMKSPFISALDRDGDGFIDPEEIEQAVAALKAMDLNDDGKIGPAEWKPRPVPRGTPMNSRSQGRFRGHQAERSSVGDDHPVRPKESSQRKDEARRPKKQKAAEEE